ncbi:MAG: glycosyltransferase, partial [Culicoidibacterales bacterium]
KKSFGVLSGRLVGKIHSTLYDCKHQHKESCVALENIHKYTQFALPQISKTNYDLAISFLTPHYIVANKVQAKQKIAWIHTDYSTIHVNQKSELKMWEQYDYIASISSDCTKAFTSVFPTLAAKIFEIENISLPSFIKAQAQLQTKAEIGYEDDFINFCTVGRFCYAKAYDRAIEVCERLVRKGYPIRWYAVGFGGDEAMMRSLVAEKQLENHFIIVGKQENPYPYIAHSDYYLQLSRYEGKAVTVREAQILAKPVMITNYATASSQITNGIDGIIVDNDDIEVMVEQISAFIEDQQQQAEIVEYLQQTNYGNEIEVMKIEKLIGA